MNRKLSLCKRFLSMFLVVTMILGGNMLYGRDVVHGASELQVRSQTKTAIIENETWHNVSSLGDDIVYDEGWRDIENEGIAVSPTKGAKATLIFYGTGIRWIGQKDINFGIGEVWLDGVKVATVDTYGRGADVKFGYTHYENTNLEEGIHTISIVPTGTKNASSSDMNIDIEKLVVRYSDDANIMVQQLDVKPSSVNLFIEETFQLTSSLQPFNANDRSIVWSSSNPEVATVSNNGLITSGNKTGVATITATIVASNQSREVQVTVTGFEEAAPLRMAVDNENILFLHHLYRQLNSSLPGPLQGGKDIQSFWASIENGDMNGNGVRSDLVGNQAIIIHASGEVKGTPATLQWYEDRFVETLNGTEDDPSDDIPFFIMVSNSGTSGSGVYNPPSLEWTEEMYEQYPNMRGIVFSENHNATSAWEIKARSEYMKDQVILASQQGGYVVYSDMNDNGDYIEKVLDHTELYKVLQTYKQNFILLAKTTSAWSSVSYNSHESVVQGAWMADIAGNWGSLIDSWMWFIEGFGPLHGNHTFSVMGGAEECRSPFTFPELFFPMRMMQQARVGATVFTYEHPDYATSIGIVDENHVHQNLFAPVFTDAIVKAMEYMKDYDIPTKEEMVAKTKFAYSAEKGTLSSLASSSAGNLLNPLYGDTNYNSYNRTTMMTYFTGRYGTIPSLPKLASQEVKDQFDIVYNKDQVINNLVNQAGIKVFFDKLYPATYEGNAYAHELNDTWYLYNNNWNIDSRVDAELDATQSAKVALTNNGLSAEVEFAPYTYLLIDDQKSGELSFNFNNLLIDKNDIWDGYIKGNGRPGDGTTWHWDSDNDSQFYEYVRDYYIPELERQDDRYRDATITLTGFTEEPTLEIKQGLTYSEGTHQYDEPITKWDSETGTYTIQISANGWIDFVVKKEMSPQFGNYITLSSTENVVEMGQSFSLNVNTSDLASSFTVLEAIVNYDPEELEFLLEGAAGSEQLDSSVIESLQPNFSLIGSGVKPDQGKIYIVMASNGNQNAVKDGALFKLNGKVKGDATVGTTTVSLTDVNVSIDGSGTQLNSSQAAYQLTIIAQDRAGLQSLIDHAQNIHDKAIEGSKPGQYSRASRVALQTAIGIAHAILVNTDASQSQINTAISNLNTALKIFANSVVKQPTEQVVDLSRLNAAITIAENQYTKAVEGNKIGQYVIGSKATLRSAINAAKNVHYSTQDEVTQALNKLNAAMEEFSKQFISLIAGQTQITINDLSFLAKYYGVSHGSTNWNLVEKADILDGEIVDIRLLAAIAQMILDNWRKE